MVRILLLVWVVNISCKTSSTIKQDNCEGGIANCIDFQIDKLGYIYVVNKANEIIKYDQNHKILYEYSNKRLGEISNIDVTNPFKILVYYEYFQLLIALDNTLAEINRIDLSSLGYFNIACTGSSNDNKIWMYEPQRAEMIKITDNGEVNRNSNSLLFEVDQPFRPILIKEKSNIMAVLNEDGRLYLFDNFGQLVRKVHITDIKHFQIINDHAILVLTPDGLLQYDYQSQEEREVTMKHVDYAKINLFGVGEDRFYWLQDDCLLFKKEK